MSPRRVLQKAPEGEPRPECEPEGMFARVFNGDLLSFHRMSRADILVWISLDRRCLGGTSYAYQSISTIADETGLLERTVKTSLQVLLKLGAIKLGAKKGKRKTNSYKTTHRALGEIARKKRGEKEGEKMRKSSFSRYSQERVRKDESKATSDPGITGPGITSQNLTSDLGITSLAEALSPENISKFAGSTKSFPHTSDPGITSRVPENPRLVIPGSPDLVIPGSPVEGTCSDPGITQRELKEYKREAPARTIHEGRAAGSPQEDTTPPTPADPPCDDTNRPLKEAQIAGARSVVASVLRSPVPPREVPAAKAKVRTRGPERLLHIRSQYINRSIDVALTQEEEADLVEVLEAIPADLYEKALKKGRLERRPLSEFVALVEGMNGGCS